MPRSLGLLALLCMTGVSRAGDVSSSAATAWGDLRGQFVYDGEPLPREKLDLNKDVEYCMKHSPLSDALLINKTDRGVANVVIWLDVKKTEKAPPVHESYAKTASAKVLLDNDGCRFTPHVCVLRTSQTLVVGNADPITHTAAFFLTRNDPLNVLVPMQGGTVERRLAQPETVPSQVSCSIHAWMKGWIVVKDHPYVAVTDEHGRFEMKNVPGGEWKFRVWHELPGYVTRVTRDGKSTEWDKGTLPHTVRPGMNDLGRFGLAPELFRK